MRQGDRVAVDDWGLREMRHIMREAWAMGPLPNRHGIVDEVVGDTAYILFDDGSLAPYPLHACDPIP